MNGTKRMRYATFSMLYFAQGSILGYFTALNAIYLRSFGISMSHIGIFSAVALMPLILKIFLGMLSDRINLFGLGFRKPYIILGLLIQAGGQLVFPLINPAESFVLLTMVAFLSLTGMAMYDTCTDGFALDTTPEEDEGTVQGIMVAGRALGIVLISATVGLLSELANWDAVFISLAVMTLIPVPMVLILKEPSRPPGRTFEWAAFRAFGKKPIVALGLLGVLGFIVASGTNQLINPFLQETFGISYMMAGFYAAVWGLGVIMGGLSGGKLTDKIGHPRSVKGAVIAAMMTVFLIAFISNPLLAWPLIFLFGLSYGYFETVYFAASMGKTDMRIAASMFAILMAVANIGSGIGLAGGGFLSDEIGYQWTFILFSLLNLLALPLLRVIFGRQADKRTTGRADK
ncbi:MAG: MFS transporter [Bacteroidales bacterium]|nr:MFS transporter [Bacteroidales bacterium]